MATPVFSFLSTDDQIKVDSTNVHMKARYQQEVLNVWITRNAHNVYRKIYCTLKCSVREMEKNQSPIQ